MPEAHPLSATAIVRLDKLLVEPLIIFPRRIVPSLFDAIFSMYHAVERSPQIAQEAIQMQTIVNLVSAGLGIAWVPASVRQFQRSGVVYRTVKADKGRMMPECETSLVWSRRGPVLEKFLTFMPV